MKISEALSKARDIQVFFEAAVLNVTYRPVAYTYAEMESLTENDASLGKLSKEERTSRLNRIIELIQRVVVAWDLEDENGVTIDPQNEESLRVVPLNVFTEIMKAVQQDQRVSGEAESPSSDG